MSDMQPSTLATISVTDALADALRELILDGAWPSGAVITEVEVARRFGVSRPSAKTAVRTLVHEGLLRQDAHRPPYVPRLTAQDVADLFFVRVPLELAIVERLCATRPADGLAAAALQIERLRVLPPDAPASAFVAADLGFHRALADAAGSARMGRAYATLAGEIHLNMIQTRQALGWERILREHSAIHAAISAGDAVTAVTRAREHLVGALAALTQPTAQDG